MIVNLFLGLYHEDFGKAATPWMMFFHKSLGITVLGLSLARLLWRLGHRPPPFDPVLRPWEALLARITHWLFYVMMIAIPLTGWLLSSSSGRATNFFGLFEIAPLPVSSTTSKATATLSGEWGPGSTGSAERAGIPLLKQGFGHLSH